MSVTLQEIAAQLVHHNQILILVHQNPDGDTLGSGFALYYALKQLGKTARVACSDPIPQKFQYLCQEYEETEFTPDYVVSVDVADVKLLGPALKEFRENIDISIDHHRSNKQFAAVNYVDAEAAATCEIMFPLLQCLDITWNPLLADCLYTGLITDTGCFKFPNTTAHTHLIAAQLIQFDCHYTDLNRELFDTKTRQRLAVEQQALEAMEYYHQDQIALTVISQDIIQKTGIDPAELDGVAAIPRQIEGVEVGVTMRERLEGGYKISVRTTKYLDACAICQLLGGGGHQRAAGCLISLPLPQAKLQLLEAIEKQFAIQTGEIAGTI